MLIFPSLPFFAFFVKTCEMALQCKTTESVYGKFLRSHVMSTRQAGEPMDCMAICDKHSKCKSWNFWLDGKKCELNDADRYNRPRDYEERTGVIYGDNSAPEAKSCADVKQRDPGAPSGYYWVSIANKTAQVFCDMSNYGGGWTLVASISSQSNDHLQQAEHNCFNSTLCVPFVNASIVARKLSDENIHGIEVAEGTFRVDDLTDPAITVFYKIPSGVSSFDSSCRSGSCPRIIISHSFPYTWESNCKGIQLGYKIYPGCYSVFDGHDNQECGSLWRSSEYNSGKRILYGYPAPCGSKGLWNHQQGLLFVK